MLPELPREIQGKIMHIRRCEDTAIIIQSSGARHALAAVAAQRDHALHQLVAPIALDVPGC